MKKMIWILGITLRFCFSVIFLRILLTIISPIVTIILNLISKRMVNDLTESVGTGALPAVFIGLAFVYLAIYFFSMAFRWVNSAGWYHFTYKINKFFRKIFLWKSYITPQEKLLDSDFMDKYSFISENLGSIAGYINSFIYLLFGAFGTLASTVGFYAVYEPLLILYIIPVTAFIIFLYIRTINKKYELDRTQTHDKRIAGYYGDVLSGHASAKELRIYGYRDSVFDKWEGVSDRLRHEEMKVLLKNAGLWNIYYIARLLCRIFAIAILFFGVSRNKYDIGTFVMLFGLIETSILSIENLGSVILQEAYKNAKYLTDFYDFIMPTTYKDMKNISRSTPVENMDCSFGPFRELEVKNVRYKYPTSDKYAVDGVSLTIRRGEIISILGYNGSGKTTISKILSGSLSPESGKVTLNGVEVNDETRTEVFKYFGFAPQEFSRFSVPIKDLIGLGRSDKMDDPEELEKAYAKAGIHTFTHKYPQGENTILGKEYDENGVDLSGGEWQKLIIGSAYMGEPEILLMDEPTAAIDPLKEMELIANFRENLSGKTAVLISHRIGFARLADRIIMMENGKITESGTHEELLQRGGYYAKLFMEQKKLYEGSDLSEEK